MKSLRELGCEPEVVRGNHDSYIISVLKELQVTLHQPSLSLGRYIPIRGHLPFDQKTDHLIMGHEHPVLAVKDSTGIRQLRGRGFKSRERTSG